MNVATQIRGNFPGFATSQSKPKPEAKRPQNFIDVDKLEVCSDPLPSHRAVTEEHKYDAVFDRLQPRTHNQCIKCDRKSVGRICGALRKYIERHKLKDHIVKSTTNYEQTNTGRVWLVYVGKDGVA